MGLLICRIEICLHVECVHTLLSHAAARPTPEMASPFLYQCIRTVRRRTNLCIVPRINRFVRVVSAVSRIPTNEILWQPEETRNFETFVRQHLVNRTAPEFPSYCDISLNLGDALMASVCVGPLRENCTSPIYCWPALCMISVLVLDYYSDIYFGHFSLPDLIPFLLWPLSEQH